MPVFDDIKEQTAKMKDMTLKGKFKYFWGYYKIHTLIILGVIIMVVWLIYDMTHQPDNALYALLLNSGGYGMTEDAGNEFAEYAGIDLRKKDVFLDTTMVFDPDTVSQDNYYSSMKIAALFAAGEVDCITCSESLFHNYGLNEAFIPLNELMTQEQIAAYGMDLFYIDRAEIAAKETEEVDIFAEETGEADTEKEEIDHRDPSQMEEPIAIGFYLNVADIPFFTENYLYYGKEAVVYGFVGNSLHHETAIQFLDYLTK